MMNIIETPYGSFPENYQLDRLEDLCVKKIGIQTGPFGSQLHNSDYVPIGTPILTVEHLGENRILHEDIPRVTDRDRQRLSRYSIKKGDIIFSRVGSVDRRALVREGEEGWLFSGRCLRVRPDPDKLDPIFLSYIMGLPSFKEYIRKIAVGATMPSINTEILSDIPICYPPLPTQHAIARILGSLDDKIEINRQMNETLEAMARTIFQSWFVDFDPVRAKAEGRQPAEMDAATAALFPDAFEEVDAREVPMGWGVASLPDVFDINPTRSLAKGQVAPYLDMQNVPTQGHRPSNWIQREFGSGTKFINGDTLLARITPCLENGKTIFVDFLNDDEIGWGSTEYIVLRPKSPLPPEFGYLLARDEDFRAHAILNMSGSSGRQRVPSKCFDSYQIVVPSHPIAEKFGELIKPLMTMIKKNDEQSRTLAHIRDALLPKLMSGELHIQNVT